MADYTIAEGAVAAHGKTLTPDVEDVVTFAGHNPDRGPDVVVLIHPNSTGPVYVCTGNTAATVAGAHCRAVWPGYGLPVYETANVRLISATADTYSVEQR